MNDVKTAPTPLTYAEREHFYRVLLYAAKYLRQGDTMLAYGTIPDGMLARLLEAAKAETAAKQYGSTP